MCKNVDFYVRKKHFLMYEFELIRIISRPFIIYIVLKILKKNRNTHERCEHIVIAIVVHLELQNLRASN